MEYKTTKYPCSYDVVALFGCDPAAQTFGWLKKTAREKGWDAHTLYAHRNKHAVLELISLAPPEKAEEALAAKKAAEEAEATAAKVSAEGAAATAPEATETDAVDYDPVAFFAAKGYDPPEKLSFPSLKRAMTDLGFSTIGIKTKTEFLERIACGPPGTLPPKTSGA